MNIFLKTGGLESAKNKIAVDQKSLCTGTVAKKKIGMGALLRGKRSKKHPRAKRAKKKGFLGCYKGENHWKKGQNEANFSRFFV